MTPGRSELNGTPEASVIGSVDVGADHDFAARGTGRTDNIDGETEAGHGPDAAQPGFFQHLSQIGLRLTLFVRELRIAVEVAADLDHPALQRGIHQSIAGFSF
ncbi:hypothetical protein [Mesorhizobium sp.]|uniref:hypothetical protein n=1 Tax=Mesorhizobium sp. TaxID=1871066 RepID=UPI00257E1C69|nr:hypothetical protein [Mesorhizobium sp.]